MKDIIWPKIHTCRINTVRGTKCGLLNHVVDGRNVSYCQCCKHCIRYIQNNQFGRRIYRRDIVLPCTGHRFTWSVLNAMENAIAFDSRTQCPVTMTIYWPPLLGKRCLPCGWSQIHTNWWIHYQKVLCGLMESKQIFTAHQRTLNSNCRWYVLRSFWRIHSSRINFIDFRWCDDGNIIQ